MIVQSSRASAQLCASPSSTPFLSSLVPPRPVAAELTDAERYQRFGEELDVLARAAELQKTWSENWEGLGKDEESSVNRIDDAIGRLRGAALATLQSLH